MAVSGPTIGAMAAAAASTSLSFVPRSTRSTTPTVAGASVTAAGAIRRSPSGLWTESPWARIAARCAPRATKVTSAPTAARRAPM
jgi:hypothetical protein